MPKLFKLWYRLFWNTNMSKAPKDRPIIARLEPFLDKECPNCSGTSSLCLYHAHAEGMDFDRSDISIIQWGGGFDDRSYEYPNEGYLPDWWFRADGDYETAANPIAWKYI